jgi:hypothetical protein
MLLNFPMALNSIDNLKIPQKAKVVNNQDPLKLGRVQVIIPGMIEGDASLLPWIYPDNQHAFGGDPKTAHFVVPNIGTDLTVNFKNGNIYHAVYSGRNHSQDNYNISPFTPGYPQAYGHVDPSNNSLVIDRKAQTFTYKWVADVDNQTPITTTQAGSNEDLSTVNAEDSGGSYSLSRAHNLIKSINNKIRSMRSKTSSPKVTYTMDKDGNVTLNCASLTIIASGAIKTTSGSSTTITSSSDITMKASTINMNQG